MTNAVEADLKGAHLPDADFKGANLFGAHLEGAYLSQAHLEKADLRGAYLSQKQIEQATGDETTILPEHLEMPRSWTKEATEGDK